MASLRIVSVAIAPLSAAGAAVCTVDYVYELILEKIDVHKEGSKQIEGLIPPATATGSDLTSSGIDYENGTVTVSPGGFSGGTTYPMTGAASVEVWGADQGRGSIVDADDLKLSNQDPHTVTCKEGTQTFTRTFTVAARNLDEDFWADEIYLLLKIRFAVQPLEAESATIVGNWM